MADVPATDTPQDPDRPGMRETFGLNRYRFTRGKWILLAVAGVMVLVGAGLAAMSGGAPKPETVAAPGPSTTSTTRTGSGSSSLIGNSFSQSGSSFASNLATGSSGSGSESATSSTPEVDDLERSVGSGDYSKLFVNGGFGLFAGFAIGFALRAFFRLAIIITGAYLIALMLMAHAGWVEVHWDVIEGYFNGMVSNLGAQFESFKTFVTGAIPGSGMTAVGLAMGLKQK